jgi:glycosyltransferase involved in cell wall biosynthesis
MVSFDDISIAMASIPPRFSTTLPRAIASIERQSLRPKAVHISYDVNKEGAPATRQRALDGVTTPWVAFLDDDDEFHSHHLYALMNAAKEQEADFVYSWFDSPCGFDPFPLNRDKPWNPDDPVETTITVLVRTELAQEVGFDTLRDYPHGTGEDRRLALGIRDLGAKIYHLVQNTWIWHNCGGNTSGRSDRW